METNNSGVLYSMEGLRMSWCIHNNCPSNILEDRTSELAREYQADWATLTQLFFQNNEQRLLGHKFHEVLPAVFKEIELEISCTKRIWDKGTTAKSRANRRESLRQKLLVLEKFGLIRRPVSTEYCARIGCEMEEKKSVDSTTSFIEPGDVPP